MMNLRNLLAQKPKPVEETPIVVMHKLEGERVTYLETGRRKCLEASGSSHILKSCLDAIFEDFKEESRKKTEQQEALKKPVREQLNKENTELSKRNLLLELKEKEIEETNQEIRQIDQDIAEVVDNPKKFGIDADKKPKAQFYIGLALLFPITLYLLVFYISASYSAFFKEFSLDTTVFAAIFDGQALSKAYNDPNGGLLEVIFICTIPFAFMGLGYLIHMFQKSKGTAIFKIIALFMVTFLFDAILAYLIEKKIFDFEKLPGQEFTIGMAFQSVEFWGIIFAGFVIYVIWGLVFDFIMHEHENIDKIKIFIVSQQNKKINLLNHLKGLKEIKDSISNEISSIKGKIIELQSNLDGFIFEKKRYLRYHSQYLEGWLLAIGSEIAMAADNKTILVQECQKVSEIHLERNNVSNHDHENMIYTSKHA